MYLFNSTGKALKLTVSESAGDGLHHGFEIRLGVYPDRIGVLVRGAQAMIFDIWMDQFQGCLCFWVCTIKNHRL